MAFNFLLNGVTVTTAKAAEAVGKAVKTYKIPRTDAQPPTHASPSTDAKKLDTPAITPEKTAAPQQAAQPAKQPPNTNDKSSPNTPEGTANNLKSPQNTDQAVKKPATGKSAQRKKKGKRKHYGRSGICRDLDKLARRYKLPPLFFARLIWQESGFNPNAVSPAGAEGIAQFMPGTAEIWGLEDPFDPAQSLIKSAQYLSWLRKKLGNLGLAAAGYNAGSQRVVNWRAGRSFMPLETRNYVYAITGYSVEDWAEGRAEFKGIKVKKKLSVSACKQLALALRDERVHLMPASYSLHDNIKRSRKGKSRRRRLPRLPWGVQLAGSFKRGVAMRQYRQVKRKYASLIGGKRVVLRRSRNRSRGRRLFHNVRIGTRTRAAAVSLCNRLRARGGYCVVKKN